MHQTDFDFDPRTRILFGPGTLQMLGQLVLEYGGANVLLVTDHGLKQAGHEDRALTTLRDAGLSVHVFDDVHSNPTTLDIESGTEFARSREVDFIVGLGGGSSLDAAKGINFLLTNGGRMPDYKGVGKARKPMLPLIAVPTTSGTGSEAQSFAVIADPVTHMKMACGDKKAAARVALLDPELTITMPQSVTAMTGIDAISHAVESYVTLKRGPVSQLFSRESWRLLSEAFLTVLENGEDLEARGAMQLGAFFGGAAIENSMLGATHALANPLSAHCELLHGVAIGVMLPHVIAYNAEIPEVREMYGRLAEDADLCAADDPAAAVRFAERIAEFVQAAGQPTSLDECDVPEELLETMAAEAAQQWTGQFNPRPVDATALLELYRCAYHDPVETS